MKLISLLFLVTLVSCAHHKDVRPSASGEHTVRVSGEEKVTISRQALDQANHYCEEAKKRAAIVKENVKFIGSGTEEGYRNAKGISKAVKAVGGAAFVFGGKRESDAGALGTIGGQAADAYLGNGYEVTMIFKCN
jgi:hypothetical protein